MAPRHDSHLRLVSPPASGDDPAMVIDCETCARQHSSECDDCVVTYLVDHEPGVPVVLGRQEQRAVELLADAGLVPRSRFRPRHGVA